MLKKNVGVVTRERVVRGLSPGRGKAFLSSTRRPNRAQQGQGVFSALVKRTGRELDY